MEDGKEKKDPNVDTPNVVTAPDTKIPLTTSPSIRIVRELISPIGSTAVSYTDDLSLIAAGQEDGSILLFDKNSEYTTMVDYELSLLKEPCTDIKIKASPKGGFHKSLLASYFSGHIKLWDTTIRKPLFTIKEERQVYGLCYHPKSQKFVSVGNDYKVNVYDEETRVTERVLASSGVKGNKNGHNDSVCSAMFHPKNNFEIVSGGVDNTVQFWDLRVPYSVRYIEGVQMYGDGLDISKDGKVILCGVSNSKDCVLQIYDYSTGKLIKHHTKPGCFVYCCKFMSPIYVGLGGFYTHTFRIVNMKTLQIYGFVSGLQTCVTNFSPCRKMPQFKTNPDALPVMVISSGEKVVELEIVTPEDAFSSSAVLYEEQ